VRASRILLAVGIVFVGVCAAWPFRQFEQRGDPQEPLGMPLELPLRRPDAPLELAPRSDVSPAIGLDTMGGAGSLASASTPELANLAPPPALPVSFQPMSFTPTPSDWRPEPIVRRGSPPGKPRTYRIRDGDTLEKIAERLLGSRERAGELFEANRALLSRPDLLPVGITIMIPAQRVDDLEPVRREH
jgi:nucleoid-associated protein YgaU